MFYFYWYSDNPDVDIKGANLFNYYLKNQKLKDPK